jgi:hypothetical protein
LDGRKKAQKPQKEQDPASIWAHPLVDGTRRGKWLIF